MGTYSLRFVGREPGNVPAMKEYLSGIRNVPKRQAPGERTFSRTGWPNKTQSATALYGQVQVMQRRSGRGRAEDQPAFGISLGKAVNDDERLGVGTLICTKRLGRRHCV